MPASSCSAVPREEGHEQGLTLIEVMVALFLLGIVLSAVAASLITFTRSASSSERRVQATALLNELHEEFQALPFDLAGNLDTEVAELAAVGAAVNHTPPDPPSFDFEGRDGVVVFEDCNEAVDEDCRRRVPRAYQVITESSDDPEDPDAEPPDNPDAEPRELYEVYQIVTWVDRSGDGIGDTKRLTTIVEWQWLGRDYAERFESERAPTISEAGAPSAARAFLTMPSTVQLASPTAGVSNTIDTAIPAVANFTVAVDQFSVELVIRRLNTTNDALVEESIPLSADLSVTDADGGYTRFVGAIGPIDGSGEARRFPVGILQFRVEGTPLDGPMLSGPADVRFVGQGITLEELEGVDTGNGGGDGNGDGEDGNGNGDGNGEDSGVPLEITSTNASPSTVNVANNGGAFRCTLTITANVRGLSTSEFGQVNGQVTATYTDTAGGKRTLDLDPDGAVVESGATFSLTLGTSSNHGFTHNSWRDVTFEVGATRFGEPEQSAIDSTNIVRISSNNSAC